MTPAADRAYVFVGYLDFFRETLLASKRRGMALWREKLFVVMARNSTPATAYFRIPANRVVELGAQVRL